MIRPRTAAKVLLVEGKDDLHIVANLCSALEMPDFGLWIKEKGGYDILIQDLEGELLASELQHIGILVDADIDAHNRWMALRDRLVAAGYTNLPPRPDRHHHQSDGQTNRRGLDHAGQHTAGQVGRLCRLSCPRGRFAVAACRGLPGAASRERSSLSGTRSDQGACSYLAGLAERTGEADGAGDHSALSQSRCTASCVVCRLAAALVRDLTEWIRPRAPGLPPPTS